MAERSLHVVAVNFNLVIYLKYYGRKTDDNVSGEGEREGEILRGRGGEGGDIEGEREGRY